MPLCVDMDGTLVRSDLLVESVFVLLRKNILYAFLLPVWLARGKAHLKRQVAARAEVDASLLPYQRSFTEFLHQQRLAGRRLVLATASDQKYANAVAEHLGLFDEVLASDGETNLSRAAKGARLVERFGEGRFAYAGNAKADLAVWDRAGTALLVNPERGVNREVERRGVPVEGVFDDRRGPLVIPYLKAMRLHQWLKNLLVLVPLLLGHRIDEAQALGHAALAFFAFGLCASSVYLLNDLLDLPSDRQHRSKRNRPFAAGTIPLVNGTALIPVLLAGATALGSLVSYEFLAVLGAYYVTTLAYSFRLKRSALIDVLVLAALYTLRIIAGIVAVSAAQSFWLLSFSMFFFLSLALVKRYTEVAALCAGGQTAGRGYRAVDLETLAQFGTASGYMAVLVLALYINSQEVKALYTHPEVIWLLCPLVLYLVSRIWLLARRDEMHEDPVVWVARDHRSQLLVAVGALLLWGAS